jgi:peptidoglycan/LPS O-acetylase OafA/YrhL
MVAESPSPSSSTTGFLTGERILPLDSLRGLAALGVTLFWHYGHFGPGRPFGGAVADWLYSYGLMLVDLLFLLSGFVLSHVYLEKIAKRRVRPLEFFVLRFSRLYPLHLLTLVVVASLQLYRAHSGLGAFVYEANDFFHLLLNLAFLQYGVVRTAYSFNGPSWSLTVEELAYLAFFASLYFFGGRHRLAFLALLAAGAAVNLLGWDAHVLNLDVSRGLVGFFSGCLAYRLHRVAEASRRSRLLAAAAAVLLAGVVFHYTRSGYPPVSATLLAHSLLIFPAVVLVVLNVPLAARVFSLRPLAYLGEISYSVYMIHFPVQIGIATAADLAGVSLAADSVSFFLFYAALTLGLAPASLHLFERPAQAALRARLLAPS